MTNDDEVLGQLSDEDRKAALTSITAVKRLENAAYDLADLLGNIDAAAMLRDLASEVQNRE